METINFTNTLGVNIIFLVDQKTIEHILNSLRKASVTWHGRSQCYARHRRKKFVRFSKTGNAIYKFEWQCSKCKQWYLKQEELEVDHIIEIGPFKGSFDVHIPRIFCDQQNLQLLCLACHKIKTGKYNSANNRYKRKK